MIPEEESKFVKFLYNTFIGRCLLKILTTRIVSKFCGFLLDRKISKILIKNFIRKIILIPMIII